MAHFQSGGARPRVWRHGFFASRIISQVPGSSEAPDQGEIALEVWLDQLFFRRGDRTGEPASLLIHRGPTLTRAPEKWIRWLVNRGEGFFEARSAVNWVFLLTFLGNDGAAALWKIVKDRVH